MAKPRLIVPIVFALVVGALLGYVFRGIFKGPAEDIPLRKQPIEREAVTGQTASRPQRHQDDSSKTTEANELVTSLQGQIRRLTQENQSLQARVSAVTRPTADDTKIVIPKSLIPRLMLRPGSSEAIIGDGYTVGQDVVDVLAITENEKGQIEKALIEARARIDELEIKHSTVVSQTAAAVELSIAPFASDGETIRSRLAGDIRAVLGDERSGYFAEFARQAIDDRFNHFGQASQKVTVTMQDDGRMRVDSNFTIKTPQRTSSGMRSSTLEKDRFPENFLHLFDVK